MFINETERRQPDQEVAELSKGPEKTRARLAEKIKITLNPNKIKNAKLQKSKYVKDNISPS